MKRVQGTKGVSLFECINADQNKWNVRWDVQDNPADKEGKVKGVNYMEETFLFKPDLSDVKSVMSIWCSGEEAGAKRHTSVAQPGGTGGEGQRCNCSPYYRIRSGRGLTR